MLKHIFASVLDRLDDIKFLECDGMTRLISSILQYAGVEHKIVIGMAQNTEIVVSPHLWIDLEDGWRIDYRARKWLGDRPEVPNGIFVPEEYSAILYTGKGIRPTREDLRTGYILGMTEGVSVQALGAELRRLI